MKDVSNKMVGYAWSFVQSRVRLEAVNRGVWLKVDNETWNSVWVTLDNGLSPKIKRRMYEEI